MKTHKKSGFTLVELIIVITILAILATIAFISFQGFSKNARDGNRLATMKQLVNSLEVYGAKNGTFPTPDSSITGSVGPVALVNKGIIGENVSRILGVNQTPLDPLTKNNYVYAISPDSKEYQIAGTLEALDAQTKILSQTYAEGGYEAKVMGNYKGFLKFSSGGTWLANVPSLIFSSGSNLLDNNTIFVVNGYTNLPYIPNKDTQTGSTKANTIVNFLTNTGGTSLQSVDITLVSNETQLTNAFSGTTLASFGGNINTIKPTVLSAITNNQCQSGYTYKNGTCMLTNLTRTGMEYTNIRADGGGGGMLTVKCPTNYYVSASTAYFQMGSNYNRDYYMYINMDIWNSSNSRITNHVGTYPSWYTTNKNRSTFRSTYTYSSYQTGITMTNGNTLATSVSADIGSWGNASYYDTGWAKNASSSNTSNPSGWTPGTFSYDTHTTGIVMGGLTSRYSSNWSAGDKIKMDVTCTIQP